VVGRRRRRRRQRGIRGGDEEIEVETMCLCNKDD
jgi:hypothetical protein